MTTGSEIIRHAHCEACGHTYVSGPGIDDYKSCPRCNPGQPRPFRERVRDPSCFMGPEYFWDPLRGMGQWTPLAGRAVIPIADIEALRDLLPPNTDGRPVFDVIRAELRKLHPGALPVTPSTRPRYEELADRCQRLEDDLRRKRAQCDEQRDEIERLRARK